MDLNNGLCIYLRVLRSTIMKRSTHVSVDDEILKDAKDKGINVSDATEKGILNELGKVDVGFIEPKNCSICKVDGRRETVDEVKKKHFTKNTNLTWLYPDEIWLCNKCLRFKVNQVKKGKNYGL